MIQFQEDAVKLTQLENKQRKACSPASCNVPSNPLAACQTPFIEVQFCNE